MPQNPSPAPKKSNFWLVIIVLVILIALLWPILRRGKSTTTLAPTGEELATTSEEAPPVSEETSLVPSTPTTSVLGNQTEATASRPVSAPAALSLKVFFSNQKRDSKTWQCGTVFPVARTVPATSAVARAALTELIRGPQLPDRSAGFFTALSPNLIIKQLTINDGVARVDFRPALVSITTGNPACLKDQIRAQITETLKQFPTVRSVVISANGILF